MTASVEHGHDPSAPMYDPMPPGEPPPVYREPPRFTLAAAARRHWFLTLLPVALLAAAGVFAGHAKKPTYSATATINVGKSDINTQATPGYLVAAEALASSYSRLVQSQHIAIPAAKKVGETPAEAGKGLTAVPISNQPTFTITATAASSAKATALANAAISALQRFVARTATQGGGTAQLLAEYRKASSKAFSLQSQLHKLEAHAAPLDTSTVTVTTPTTNTVSQAQITAAKVAAQTAQLEAQALSGQYLNLAQGGVAPTLDVLIAPTGETTTNRKTNMERFGIVGAVGGLVIGLAFASLAGAVDVRRARRAIA
jgi:capsular polysaccharide biosynthesis protein